MKRKKKARSFVDSIVNMSAPEEADLLKLSERLLNRMKVICELTKKVWFARESHHRDAVTAPQLCRGEVLNRNPHASADVDKKDKIQGLLICREGDYRLLHSLVEYAEVRLLQSRNGVSRRVIHLHIHVHQRYPADELRRVARAETRDASQKRAKTNQTAKHVGPFRDSQPMAIAIVLFHTPGS